MMTREELEMRKIVRESDVIDKTNGTELAKAFNYLWKKYIEQEPCEDCISRKDALAPYKELKDDDVISVWLIKKNIEQQLSVTPTRKTGKWTNGNPICTCCGEDKFKDLDADIWADWKPKYCPNCGAKMESEEK